MTSGWRVTLRFAIATLGSVLVALFAGYVSRAVWRPAGLVVPWGLALAVLGSVGLVVLARAVAPALGLVAAGGWVVGLLLLLTVNRGGDFVIAQDTLGWSFIMLGLGSVALAAVVGKRGR